MNSITYWIVFNAAILTLLVLDLFVLNKKTETQSVKSALKWSAFWVGLAILFNFYIYYQYLPLGKEAAWKAASDFFIGYLTEESLSIDNLFVFMLVFNFFRVPQKYQRKVLFWGIIGALVLRGLFIFVGVELIEHFSWTKYILGAFLIVTGVKMFGANDNEDINPEKNPVVKMAYRLFRVLKSYEGEKFFIKKNGIWFATPLFIVVLVVETTDVVFALDSIPAILGITEDPYIVYTSNVFALLGLRSLYFALSGIMELFHYINYGLAVILSFIGIKLILNQYFGHEIIHSIHTLIFIASVLTVSISLSILLPKKNDDLEEEEEAK